MHNGWCPDVAAWDVVRGVASKARWSHRGPVLPVIGIGTFPEGSEELLQVSKQDIWYDFVLERNPELQQADVLGADAEGSSWRCRLSGMGLLACMTLLAILDGNQIICLPLTCSWRFRNGPAPMRLRPGNR